MLTLFVLLAAAEPAQTAATPPPPPAKKEKKVCRSEAVSGSIMPKMICTTAAERDANSQAAQQALENQSRSSERDR
jgi:hypothetical protein